MTSDLSDQSYKYWYEPLKWFNHFKIEWVYLKDIKYERFQGMKGNWRLIVNMCDGKEIPFDSGKAMLKIYQN